MRHFTLPRSLANSRESLKDIQTPESKWRVHEKNLHAKECVTFVPMLRQKPGTDIKSFRCHCGEKLRYHAAFFEKEAVPADVINTLVPQEIRDMCAYENWGNIVPVDIPDIGYLWEEAFKVIPTNACGKVTFSNTGGVKPSKFLRVSDEDPLENMWSLVDKEWGLMSDKPDLVVSVVGGAKNFRLEGRRRDKFENGLLKIAETTQAIFITSGFDVGVMKAVGSIMKIGQSYSINDHRVKNNIKCIGIGPWGFVKNRRSLEELSFSVKYEMSSWSMDEFQPIPLNPHHTHFILVDNGYRNRFNSSGNIAKYRAELEVRMNQESPVVLVVVEGGMGVLADIKHSVERSIPVVVCKGTGRAADLMAYAVSRSGDGGELSADYEEKVTKYLMKLYGNTWLDETERSTQIQELLKTVKDAIAYKNLIIVFDIMEEAGLDFYVLEALFKGTKLKWPKEKRLDLAISLNRPDLADQLLFGQNITWPKEMLHKTLATCILKDLDGFVRLLLDQEDLKISEFLTADCLERIYQDSSTDPPIWFRVLGKWPSQLSKLHHVGKVLEKLLDSFDSSVYRISDLTTPVHKPFLQLFIWAVLNERSILAMVFWEYEETPVATALLGSWLYHKLSSLPATSDSQWVNSLQKEKSRFETLAVETLDWLHSRYPIQAAQYVARDTPLWGKFTCLQMAAAADAKNFVASQVCQTDIKREWLGDVRMNLLELHRFIVLPFCGSFSTRLDKANWKTKMKKFYCSPRVKFVCYIYSYLAFLSLFTYTVLFDVQKKVSVLEGICAVWILSILFDEIHRSMCVPALSKKSLFKLWRGWFYLIYILCVIIAFIGFCIHAFSGEPKLAKDIYSFTCVMFFLRILRFYTASQHLGPKLHIIRSTIRHLFFFGMITLVFLLAYGVPSQALLYDKRKAQWSVLKDIFYLPYWQVYGELQLENIEDDDACLAMHNGTELDSDQMEGCRQYSKMVPIMLAVYLFFANVLLLNLIIAIFTKIFETVESNSIKIWKYQMYFFIKEYKVKSILPTPFSLPEDFVRIFRHVLGYLCLPMNMSGRPLHNDEKRHLRWVERQVIDRYLRNLKAMENMASSNSLLTIQRSIDALHSSLISDLMIGKRATATDSSGPMLSAPTTPLILSRNDRLRSLLHDRISQTRAKEIVSTEYSPLPNLKVTKPEDMESDKDMADSVDSLQTSEDESDYFLPNTDTKNKSSM